MNLNTTKLEELLATLKKKEEEKDKNTRKKVKPGSSPIFAMM